MCYQVVVNMVVFGMLSLVLGQLNYDDLWNIVIYLVPHKLVLMDEKREDILVW